MARHLAFNILRSAASVVVVLAYVPATGLEVTAAGGSIRGTVVFAHQRSAAEARPAMAAMAAPAQRPAELRPAVVYLDSGPRGAFESTKAARATMDQRGQAFVPHVLVITAGTTVDFPNSDPFFHNVFSLSRTRPLDLGRYSQGKSKSVRFDRPGVVQVFCDIHSHMSGYILIFAHRYFAVTGPDGRYELNGVPPGSYMLAVWYEGDVRETRPVVVSGQGAAIDASFTIR